LIHPIHKI
jgi:hypothetical protein